MKSINIITMGCSKNLVDSEVLIRQLEVNGFLVQHEGEDGEFDYVMVNTCGFIGDAKEESIETILSLAADKEEGYIGSIVVFGCLSERYKEELQQEIPEVDAWFGKFELEELLRYVGCNPMPVLMPQRKITTPKHYAFLKISEGCDRACSFCAIPGITGKHTSKPMEDIVKEAEALVAEGVKEVILIAQELSYYGIDIYKQRMLAPLMEKLANINGLKWLRIHYTYPAAFPLEVLDVMAQYQNICSYMDIALQHISNNMLQLMKRNTNKEQTYELMKQCREKVPGIALRTTLLVGHPGETQADFEELKQFVRDIKFDRLGVFPYSHEENTFAFDNYDDNIPQEVKDERVAEIMEIQEQISLELNEAKVGQTMEVLIDRIEGEYFIARSQFDSPEVDNEILIKHTDKIQIGDIIYVCITKAEVHDLYANIIE